MRSLQSLLPYSTAAGMERGTHSDTATISKLKCLFKDGGIQVYSVTAKKRVTEKKHPISNFEWTQQSTGSAFHAMAGEKKMLRDVHVKAPIHKPNHTQSWF